MNKNAREKELLEEAYASLYERKNPDAGTYDAEGELPGPIAELDPDIEDEEGGREDLKLVPVIFRQEVNAEFKEFLRTNPEIEDDELEALIAADVDEEDDVDLDEDKSENKDENITQGGGTSAAAFDAEEKTGYA